MLVKREKIYIQRRNFSDETIKKTSWLILGIVPIFINYKIIARQ